MSIEVITRNLSKGDSSRLPPILLDLERQSMRLRELIALTVTEQVNELAARLAVERASVQRTEAAAEVSRYYLLTGTLPADDTEVPAVEVAIADACRAFEANRYVVLIGGAQIGDLDEIVEVPPETQVTFLRLTALRGG